MAWTLEDALDKPLPSNLVLFGRTPTAPLGPSEVATRQSHLELNAGMLTTGSRKCSRHRLT